MKPTSSRFAIGRIGNGQFRRLLLMLLVFVFLTILFEYIIGYGFMISVSATVLAFTCTSIFMNVVWDQIGLPRNLLPTLDDKAVLITGCDTGFGNKLVRDLDAKGVTVFAGCLFAEGTGAMELKKDCSDRLKVLQLDVTRDADVKAAVESVSSELGNKKLWAVVNNAGIFLVSEAECTTVEMYQKMIDVNTMGVVKVTQTFLPLLRKSNGRVVIVASMAGRIPVFSMSAYCISKHAVVAYAGILRQEVSRWSVSVHTIEPWAYKTPMADKASLCNNMLNQWNQISESVREDYGGDFYVNKFKAALQRDKVTVSDKPEEVVDCLIDATIGAYPKARYVPGFAGKVMSWIATNLPIELSDVLLHLITSIVLKPKDKKEKSG